MKGNSFTCWPPGETDENDFAISNWSHLNGFQSSSLLIYRTCDLPQSLFRDAQFSITPIRLFAPRRSPSKGRIDGGEAAGSTSTGIHGQDAVETDSPLDVDDDWRHRTELFDLLVAFYPERMTQPKDNLVDLVVL